MWVILLFTAFETFLLPEPFLKKNYNFPLIVSQPTTIFDFSVVNRFSLSELTRQTAFFQYKNFDFRFGHFGKTPYHEYLLGIGFCYPVKSCLGAGLAIDGLLNRISEYGLDGVYAISAGLDFRYRSLSVVSLCKNINGPQLVAGDSIPPLFDLGLEYQANEIVSLVLDFQTPVPVRSMVNAGAKIAAGKLAQILLGLRSEPLSLVYGLNLKLARLELRYLGDLHHKLGFSHGFGVGYRL